MQRLSWDMHELHGGTATVVKSQGRGRNVHKHPTLISRRTQ